MVELLRHCRRWDGTQSGIYRDGRVCGGFATLGNLLFRLDAFVQLMGQVVFRANHRAGI